MKKENNPFKSFRREINIDPTSKIHKDKKQYSRKNMKDMDFEETECLGCGAKLNPGEKKDFCEDCAKFEMENFDEDFHLNEPEEDCND